MKQKSYWRFIWVIPMLLLTITAIPKIFGVQFMVDNMIEAGIGHMILPVGLIEILCVIIFLVPKTRKWGFLLCTAYIGGVIAAEWAAEKIVVPGIVMQVLLWVGMYFEEPSFFSLNSSKSKE